MLLYIVQIPEICVRPAILRNKVELYSLAPSWAFGMS